MSGTSGDMTRLDDFYSFSFDENKWKEVEVLGTERPGGRENNGFVIGDSSRVYLFGGYNGDCWLNDLWMFDIDSKLWTCIQESSDRNSSVENSPLSDNDSVPSRRFGYVSIVHDNKLILFGGFDGENWLNDMYEFDFTTKAWRRIKAKGRLPDARSCPAWAKDEMNVYIQGGYDGVERKDDFFACDLTTYTWREIPGAGSPPSSRYFHSCCLYGKKMYMVSVMNGIFFFI